MSDSKDFQPKECLWMFSMFVNFLNGADFQKFGWILVDFLNLSDFCQLGGTEERESIKHKTNMIELNLWLLKGGGGLRKKGNFIDHWTSEYELRIVGLMIRRIGNLNRGEKNTKNGRITLKNHEENRWRFKRKQKWGKKRGKFNWSLTTEHQVGNREYQKRANKEIKAH